MYALILANGEIAMIWFGSAVSPQIIDDLYGVESAVELDIRMVRGRGLPAFESRLMPDSAAKTANSLVHASAQHLDTPGRYRRTQPTGHSGPTKRRRDGDRVCECLGRGQQ